MQVQTVTDRLLDAIENDALWAKIEKKHGIFQFVVSDAVGCLGAIEVDRKCPSISAVGDDRGVVVSSGNGRGEPWTIRCDCIEDAQTIAISIMTCINPSWPNTPPV